SQERRVQPQSTATSQNHRRIRNPQWPADLLHLCSVISALFPRLARAIQPRIEQMPHPLLLPPPPPCREAPSRRNSLLMPARIDREFAWPSHEFPGSRCRWVRGYAVPADAATLPKRRPASRTRVRRRSLRMNCPFGPAKISLRTTINAAKITRH